MWKEHEKVFLVKQCRNGIFEMYENPTKHIVGDVELYETPEDGSESAWDRNKVTKQMSNFFKDPDKDITDEIKAEAFSGQHGWLMCPMYEGESVNRIIRRGAAYIEDRRVYLKS